MFFKLLSRLSRNSWHLIIKRPNISGTRGQGLKLLLSRPPQWCVVWHSIEGSPLAPWGLFWDPWALNLFVFIAGLLQAQRKIFNLVCYKLDLYVGYACQ